MTAMLVVKNNRNRLQKTMSSVIPRISTMAAVKTIYVCCTILLKVTMSVVLNYFHFILDSYLISRERKSTQYTVSFISRSASPGPLARELTVESRFFEPLNFSNSRLFEVISVSLEGSKKRDSVV